MKNEFLLRLSLVKGVGAFGKQRIYQFAKKHQGWELNGLDIRLTAQTTKKMIGMNGRRNGFKKLKARTNISRLKIRLIQKHCDRFQRHHWSCFTKEI